MDANEKSKEIKSAERKERIPFGTARQKLSVAQIPGKVRRWVNDVGDRCKQAQAGGYEFANEEGIKVGQGGVGSGNQGLGKKVSRTVGTKEDGKPLTAFLMEIDEDLYNEDQAEKQRKIALIDDQINAGAIQGRVGQDGRYIPKEGISYKT